MNQPFLRSTLAVFTIVLLTAGCSKSKDKDSSKTKTELITQASWKYSDATVSGVSVSSFLEACKKDNTAVFAAAGTGTADEGATKCNGADPQSTSFTWNFQSNETVLFVSTPLFTGGSNTFTVVSLSATQLVVSQNITVGGSSQNAVVTFVH